MAIDELAEVRQVKELLENWLQDDNTSTGMSQARAAYGKTVKAHIVAVLGVKLDEWYGKRSYVPRGFTRAIPD